MSVTFSIRGTDYDLEDEDSYLNVHNGNAREIFDRLGFRCDAPDDPRWDTGYAEDAMGGGMMRAIELAKLCKSALEIGPMLHDLGHDGGEEQKPGQCKVIWGSRPPGRINEHIRSLLALCEQAGDLGNICWG